MNVLIILSGHILTNIPSSLACRLTLGWVIRVSVIGNQSDVFPCSTLPRSLSRAIDPGITFEPCIALTTEERSKMFNRSCLARKCTKVQLRKVRSSDCLSPLINQYIANVTGYTNAEKDLLFFGCLKKVIQILMV